MSRLSPNALGALYMVIGSLGYVTNDALIREATEEGLGVYQALCMRGFAMTLLFAAAAGIRGDHVTREQLTRPFLVRAGCELIAGALFFAAIVRLEFANAQTILLIVPFAVTLAAALVLGETVTVRHYAAVLAGFVGVLLVVRPATDGFSFWSIVVLASAALLVVREFATKRISDDIPALSIALVTAASFTVLTGAIALFTGWHGVTARSLLLLALACLCLVVGYLLTIQTVRVGDLSVSAPFRYTTLVGAVVLGYVLFDEVPDALTFAGCGIILLAGVYTVRLDQNRQAVAYGGAAEGV